MEGIYMHTRLPIVVAFLAALAVGCGKQETPRTVANPDGEVQRVANEATRAAERQAKAMQDEWNQLAKDVDKTVRKTQAKAAKQVKQVRKQTNDLAEFAAQMAEDAKDRALDIPDVIDEFFGEASPSRDDWRRGSRSDSSRR
jgi:seryl-tRNA synthetase